MTPFRDITSVRCNRCCCATVGSTALSSAKVRHPACPDNTDLMKKLTAQPELQFLGHMHGGVPPFWQHSGSWRGSRPRGLLKAMSSITPSATRTLAAMAAQAKSGRRENFILRCEDTDKRMRIQSRWLKVKTGFRAVLIKSSLKSQGGCSCKSVLYRQIRFFIGIRSAITRRLGKTS